MLDLKKIEIYLKLEEEKEKKLEEEAKEEDLLKKQNLKKQKEEVNEKISTFKKSLAEQYN